MKEKVESAQSTLKKASSVDTELETKTAQLKEIEAMMASGDLYSWAINTINRFLIPHNKVAIPSFNREVVANVNMIPRFPYMSATFQLKGVAYYHDFGKFLADFENSFPYAYVQNLELSPVITPANDEEREKLDIKFDLVTLIKPTGP